MKTGQEIEIIQPQKETFNQSLEFMLDDEGNEINMAPHAQQIIKIKMMKPVEKYSMLRRKAK